MTSLAPALDVASPGRSALLRTRFARSGLAAHLAMVWVLVLWAVPLARAFGGRGVHTQLMITLGIAAALVVLGAWRAPWRSVVHAAVLAVAATLVCVFAATGWAGADAASGYVLAAAAYLAARRYVTSEDRRKLVATAICLASLYQFTLAFEPWWGGEDPSYPMTGTFYGHNAYAAFLLPGAIIGVGLIAQRETPWHWAGWVSAPLSTAGIVLSSSRASFAALVAGWVAMLAIGLRSRRAFGRVIAGLVLSAGVTMLLPGPPLFSHHVSPFAATEQRAATGQSLETNGGYRTQFWRGSAQVFLHHPGAGTGYHSLATASALYTPSDWQRSPNAHNGYLQSAADGGLLLAVPFIGAALVAAGWAFRRVWRVAARRNRDGPVDFVAASVAVAALGALAHSLVDADWTYPALMVEAGVLAACVAPAPVPNRDRRARLAATGAFVAIAAILGVNVAALHQWQLDQPLTSDSTATLLARAGSIFGDYRPAERVLRDVANGRREADRSQVLRALVLTDRAASTDIHLAMLRYAAGATAGVMPDAVQRARDELRLVHGSTAPYIPDLAQVLIGAGDLDAARDVLARDIAAQVAEGHALPSLDIELSLWGTRIGRGASYACTLQSAAPLIGRQAAGLPSPDVGCASTAGIVKDGQR